MTENFSKKTVSLSKFLDWLSKFLSISSIRDKNTYNLHESFLLVNEKLGRPQDLIPCIHVAGSKGKGSLSAMIANIIQESGHTCGIYTSPHILDFRERITSAKGFFSDEIYGKAAYELMTTVESIPKEEFKPNCPLAWLTLVQNYAFLVFKYAKVEYAVYEVGIGGRKDFSNIVKPFAIVLMPIEYEHTDILGDTIDKIAYEKAGIIKDNIPAIISFQNYSEAENVFIETAKSKNAPFIFVKNEVKNIKYNYNENNSMNVSFNIQNSFINTKLQLLGNIQAENASAASLVIKTSLKFINDDQINQWLSKAFLPGRFQIINKNIILDGAHTEKSVKNSLETMQSVFKGKNYYLIFSCAQDKNMKGIISLFNDIFKNIIFTQPKSMKKCDLDTIAKIAEENRIKNLQIEPELEKAFTIMKSKIDKDSNGILLVTGSFYLISEIMKIINSN